MSKTIEDLINLMTANHEATLKAIESNKPSRTWENCEGHSSNCVDHRARLLDLEPAEWHSKDSGRQQSIALDTAGAS